MLYILFLKVEDRKKQAIFAKKIMTDSLLSSPTCFGYQIPPQEFLQAHTEL